MIKFTVYNDNKNPVPYKRTTQKQKYVDSDYKKYQAYKSKIITAFENRTGKLPHQLLEKGKKYYVFVTAHYKDKTHGDTDNVAKGVNDALFAKPLSDKYIAGAYDYFYTEHKPRLEITIREEPF